MESEKIKQLYISPDTTLREALIRMDEIDLKLLIIVNTVHEFEGLISIGDIQRAIIANKSLDTPAIQCCREDVIVATDVDSNEYIRWQMLEYRMAYIPVLDESGIIKRIIFWEDIINQKNNQIFKELNLPVVIMAGGLGTRLRPLTNILPKPLLPYNNTTILENIIDNFKKYKCSNFTISVNYKADFIQFYFEHLEEKDYTIDFLVEKELMGSIGSLSLLKNKFKTSFFVSNCDILIDEDYNSIYEYHKNNENELTVVASIKNYDIPYGIIESGENGNLIKLTEKPQLSYMINCGMYILEPHLLSEIPEGSFYHMTDLIENIRKRQGKIGVFPISEKSWIDLGDISNYNFFNQINL